jgi:ankyrin repeat protein
MGGRNDIKHPTSIKPIKIDLLSNHHKHRNVLIQTKVTRILNQTYGSTSFEQVVSDKIKRQIADAAKDYSGSFSSIGTFLVRLFHTFTLTTLEAIQFNIDTTPLTEDALYEEELQELEGKPPTIFYWACQVISWTLWSKRLLRVEELAVAAAINLAQSNLSELQPLISMNAEHDLRTHMSPFVTIESGCVRLASSSVKASLARRGFTMWYRSFDGETPLETDYNLTRNCLHYLRLILGDERKETWEQCLAEVSWNHQSQSPRNPILRFLDYTCRFWPTHFRQVEDPDKSLTKMVMDFLMDPAIAKRWFHLYLLCNSHSTDPLHEGDADTESMLDHLKLAIRMARFVGLPTIPEALGADNSITEDHVVRKAPGYSEEDTLVLDTRFEYFLGFAIANDDEITVKRLLRSDYAQVAKYFPLHRSAVSSSLRCARLLLSVSDDPAKQNEEGRTALHSAAIGGSTEMIQLLISHNISGDEIVKTNAPSLIDIQDNSGEIALIVAIRMGNVEAAKLLLQAGSDINIADNSGRTALHHAVCYLTQLVESLIAHNKEMAGMGDNNGCTPLHLSAALGDMSITSALGDVVQSVDVYDHESKSPLHYAAENGHTEVAKFLISRGADKTARDESKRQPVQCAAAHGHLCTIKALMDQTSDKDPCWNQVLEAAADTGQLLVARYVLQTSYSGKEPRDLAAESGCLLSAASNGHNELVRTFLRFNADVNFENADGETSLHHAAKNGTYDVVKTLLNGGANVDLPDLKRYTPLHYAAEKGHIGIVQQLLEYGADIQARTLLYETPLHLAVSKVDILPVLLHEGADLEAVNNLHQTPLHLAVMGGHFPAVKLLLEVEADTSARDNEDRTPISYAISQNDIRILSEFLARSSEDSDTDKWRHLRTAVETGSLNALKILLDKYESVENMKDSKGRTALHIAAGIGSPEILSHLLTRDVEVNLADHFGRTPLLEAVSSEKVDNIRRLVAEGADVNRAANDGKTPLLLAAKLGNSEPTRILLDAKADPNIADEHGQTPLLVASWSGALEIVKILLEHRADPKHVDHKGVSAIHSAADNLEITKLLIAEGVDVNLMTTSNLWAPLHLAVYWESPQVATYLLEKNADPNNTTYSGKTPLHIAATRMYEDIVSILLSHGSDVNARDSLGQTPLHLASEGSSVNLLQLLLKNGADLTSKTDSGQTCLTFAASAVPEVLEYLINLRDDKGSTIWDYSDVVSAYWKAIYSDSPTAPEQIDHLVNFNPSLTKEVSEGNLTGLQVCLRNRYRDSEESHRRLDLASKLLDRGADPFWRAHGDQKSGFELAIISRDRLELELIKACLPFIPEDVSSDPRGFGFRELRIATEIDVPELWEKLKPLREAVSAETDQDGWSLDHFIYQANGRVPDELTERPIKLDKTPTALIVPQLWAAQGNTDFAANIDAAGRAVCFSGTFSNRPSRSFLLQLLTWDTQLRTLWTKPSAFVPIIPFLREIWDSHILKSRYPIISQNRWVLVTLTPRPNLAKNRLYPLVSVGSLQTRHRPMWDGTYGLWATTVTMAASSRDSPI